MRTTIDEPTLTAYSTMATTMTSLTNQANNYGKFNRYHATT